MTSLPKLSPMDLIQVSAPFDDPDFLYEVKLDGFRALAYVEDGACELVSRTGHVGPRHPTSASSSRAIWPPSVAGADRTAQ